VLEALKSSSRVAHTLAEGAVPLSRSTRMLTLAHPDKVRMGILRSNKGHLELLRIAVLDVLRLDVEVDLVLDPVVPPRPCSARAGRRTPRARACRPQGPSPRERRGVSPRSHHRAEADVISAATTTSTTGGLSGLALVQRELGGTVMTEYDNG
jgi:hypothetical protein